MLLLSRRNYAKAIAIFLLSLRPASSMADDVYNFYFQKAPGPMTVIQGGSAQPQSVLPSQVGGAEATSTAVQGAPVALQAAPAAAQSVATAQNNVSSENTHWTLNLSYIKQSNWYEYSGYGLGLQYDFNKYFGVGGGVVWTALEEKYRYSRYESGWSKADTGLDGYLGLVVTPLRINTFGYDLLSVGIEGGAMTVRKALYTQDRLILPFAGAIVGLNFSKNVGIAANHKFVIGEKEETSGIQHTQTQLSLTVKF